MSTVVIDLNDHALSVYSADGQRLASSPSFALDRSDGDIVVGEAALAQWRLQPKLINHRFWDELSLEPLPQRGNAIRSHADYACEHLSAVWRAAEEAGAKDAILVVPGSFSRQQLALLLGIAREARMPVVGLIDKAVASVEDTYPGRSLMHLDMQLHRTVLTRLSQGARLSRSSVEIAPGIGLAALHEAWVKAIARKFVSSTRLDPLHNAASEQQMFERLDGWLHAASDAGEVQVELEAGAKTHGVALSRQELIDVVAERYEKVCALVADTARAGDRLTLLLSDRVQALPGLADALGALADVQLVRLAENGAAQGAIAHAQTLRGDGKEARFVTHVPWRVRTDAVQAPAPDASAAPGDAPSHVLYNARAYPIRTQYLSVGSDVSELPYGLHLTDRLGGVSRNHCQVFRNGSGVVLEDRSTYGTFVNGARVQGSCTLSVGDRLRVGTPGHELQLIRVVD